MHALYGPGSQAAAAEGPGCSEEQEQGPEQPGAAAAGGDAGAGGLGAFSSSLLLSSSFSASLLPLRRWRLSPGLRPMQPSGRCSPLSCALFPSAALSPERRGKQEGRVCGCLPLHAGSPFSLGSCSSPLPVSLSSSLPAKAPPFPGRLLLLGPFVSFWEIFSRTGICSLGHRAMGGRGRKNFICSALRDWTESACAQRRSVHILLAWRVGSARGDARWASAAGECGEERRRRWETERSG